MPPILKPKPNIATRAAEAIKSHSPLPDWLNDAILPTDPSIDVAGIPAGGAIEPAVSAGANLISPLVSMYKNKAEREAATKAFYDSVVEFSKKFMPSGENSGWVQAAKDLVDTHPRVAAHMTSDIAPATNRSIYGDQGGAFGAAMEWHPIANRTGPGKVVLHQAAVDMTDKYPDVARSFMRHEATHAAQALGDPKVPMLYDMADKAVGYKMNPYERGARYSETAAKLGAKSSAATPISTYEQLNKLSKQLQRMGISLDRIGGPNTRLEFRKWGAEKVPENMITLDKIPEPLRSKLTSLHEALGSNNGRIPRLTVTRNPPPGKASDAMRQILETRRIGTPNLSRAYDYLAKRTGKP